MPPAYTTFDASLRQYVNHGNLTGQDHGVMQWQGMTQGAKPQVFSTFRQVGEYRQRIGVDRKFFIKRVFQRGKYMETGFIRVYGEGQDVFDQFGVVMSRGTLKFNVSTKA